MTQPRLEEVFEPKLIYLACRQSNLTRAAFVERWRQHAALGMSRPRWKNIARYVHCDVLEANGADAIGLIWHRSPAHRAAHLADTSSRLDMERDELATFARPIVEDCLVARESVIQPVHVRDNARKVFAFYTETTRPLTSLPAPYASACRGIVRNSALPAERPCGWGLRYGSIDEYWFDDMQMAEAAAQHLRSRDARVVAITNEVELYRSA